MRVYAYLDTGDGLRPVTSVAGDTVMLAAFTVQWGTDTPETQPDPSVCDFTLMDRTGRLAGDFIILAGARLVIRVSKSPTWDDIGDQFGTYSDCTFPWYQMAGRWEPPTDSGADTVFDGIVSTGGTIRQHNDEWLVDLSASSRMILWKRLASQGPTSPSLPDYHWVGTPRQRLDEMNRRAQQVGAPLADTTGLSLPPSVAPYDTDTYPTQYELLQRLYAHSPQYPLWHETMDGQTVGIGHTDLATPTGLVYDANANPYTIADGRQRPAIPAGKVATDEDLSLSILQPWTQAQVNGKSVETGGDGIQFGDSQATYTANGLPANAANLQKSISLDSDAILTSDNPSYPAWTPDEAGRTMMDMLITTIDTYAVPESVSFDSRKLDPYEYPYLYKAQPSGPIFIIGQAAGTLTRTDGTPTSSIIWISIGGTLSCDLNDGEPVLVNECTLCPMPIDRTGVATWDELDGWPPDYQTVDIPWGQLGLATQYLNTIQTQEETR